MVTLNRIVAAAMAHGPHTGLQQLADAATDPALASHYRIDAIRAHLLDMAGDHDAARTHYERAARRTLSLPEQRYLESAPTGGGSPGCRQRGGDDLLPSAAWSGSSVSGAGCRIRRVPPRVSVAVRLWTPPPWSATRVGGRRRGCAT
jgi:hypothetical protein